MYKERIRQIRERIGIPQREIAELLGIKRGLYAQYEIEYTIMPVKHLNTICNHFNISLDYVFLFTENKVYTGRKEIDKVLAGKRLRDIRLNNKLTQVKFAEILHVTQSTIAEYERGTNVIATPFLYTICKKYKVSADYLLGRTDNPKI